MDDRGDGIEEGEVALAGDAAHGVAQGRRGEGAGGDDDAVPLGGRQAGDLVALDGDERMRLQPLRHLGGEVVAIDRQRAAGGQLVAVARGQDERAGAAHLLVQQADGVRLPVVGAERVGADELGQAVRLVGVGHARGTHLVQHDGHAGTGDLPGGFGAGEAAADDVDGLVCCMARAR